MALARLPSDMIFEIAERLEDTDARNLAFVCKSIEADVPICSNSIGKQMCGSFNVPGIRACKKCCMVLKDSLKKERGESIHMLKKRPWSQAERRALPKAKRFAMSRHVRLIRRLYKDPKLFDHWCNGS